MSRSLTSRLAAVAITVFTTVAMLGVSFEAEAARGRLGGGNVGRQSTNVMQQRQAVTPPARTAQTPQAAPNAAGARAGATGAAATAGARSGASRWFGPIAGIAAGLGLAALLSSMGLGAAAAEFMASLLLIGLLVFAAIFIFRRLRGGGRTAALQGAGNQGAPMQRQNHVPQPQPATLSRRAAAPAAASAAASHPAVAATAAPPVQDESWYIPAGFDTQQFLQHAKQHFIDLQDAWDKNDLVRMREFMTDELLEAVREPVAAREPGGKTDVVLLNAHLLGIEKVAEGNLASVRFSGMLRDDSGPEAYRFEEVWNFLKPVQGGWVLAGIQQIPAQYES